MELYPNVNDPIVLRDQTDREYRSRVEDVSVGLLVVARPLDLRADEPLGPGHEVNVVWADAAGVSTLLPTRILSAHAEGALDLWSVAVTGPAVRDQRRRFVRSPAVGSVVVRSATEESESISGTLIDLSEAALRCTIEAGAADGFLGSGDQVVAEFRFGSADFTVKGRLDFLRSTAHPAAFEEVVVLFDEPVGAGDALRKEIFAKEVRKLRQRTDDAR
ncbi:MAG: hypothetical protein ACJ72O_12090 [Marmoricola sp.]